MATVTGFTSERMLVIENETVVDGEIRVDNLILQRRDGIEIDAGNVRGPKGDKGDTGVPGIIQSVNDLSTPLVYSPRMFANRAEIDTLWPTAPVGAFAITIDTAIIWQKDSVGWFMSNVVRNFADVAERDSRWLNPPDGSICQAPPGTEFRRIAGVWVSSSYPQKPQPIIGWLDMYQGSHTAGSYNSNQYSLPAPPVASRCLITFSGHHGYGAGTGSLSYTLKRVSPAGDLIGSGSLQTLAGTTTALPTNYGTIDPINAGVVEKVYVYYTITGSNNYFSPKLGYWIIPK
jgi:hypothetical protein